MPYRRGRYGPARWRGRSGPPRPNRFNDLDEDIVRVFFSLSRPSLRELFSIYDSRFGPSAASYARSVYQKWKSGYTKMSGQTLERLIDVVPLVLDFEQKVELYRAIRVKVQSREKVSLAISSPSEVELIEQAAVRIAERARGQPLPYRVSERLTWLADGDGALAKELVTAVELAQGQRVAGAVASEIRELLCAFGETEGRIQVQHIVELPYGEILISVGSRRNPLEVVYERE